MTTSDRKWQELLDQAIADAAVAHQGQKTKDGLPYILHPLHVMQQVPEHEPMKRIVAVLHDIVEDCDLWTIERVSQNYGVLVAAAVDGLSRRDGESYDDMLVRCKSHPISTEIKLLDLRHNSDLFRQQRLNDRDLRRVQKYHRARVYLQGPGIEAPRTET